MNKHFIPHLTMKVIDYPCWDLSYSVLVKGALEQQALE